jgi:hypothetical protein
LRADDHDHSHLSLPFLLLRTRQNAPGELGECTDDERRTSDGSVRLVTLVRTFPAVILKQVKSAPGCKPVATRDDRSEGFFSYTRLEKRIPGTTHCLMSRSADQPLGSLNQRVERFYSTMAPARPSSNHRGSLLGEIMKEPSTAAIRLTLHVRRGLSHSALPVSANSHP